MILFDPVFDLHLLTKFRHACRMLALACLAVSLSCIVWSMKGSVLENQVALKERDHAYLGDAHALSAEEARKQVRPLACELRKMCDCLTFRLILCVTVLTAG